MTGAAAAIQAALDEQRLRDMPAWPDVVDPGPLRVVPTPHHGCSVLTCDRARFWRAVALDAQADADRYALQLAALGHRPEPLVDGHEATYSWSRA